MVILKGLMRNLHLWEISMDEEIFNNMVEMVNKYNIKVTKKIYFLMEKSYHETNNL